MTLEEAILAHLASGAEPATATEIIDGVVAAGQTDSREVRSRIKIMADEGKVVRWVRSGNGPGRVYIYATATDTWRAVASKETKGRPKVAARETLRAAEAARDAALAEAKALRATNDFLVLRNRRLLDLLARALPILERGENNDDAKLHAEVLKNVNASKETA